MDFGCKYGGYCSDMTRTVAPGRAHRGDAEGLSDRAEAQLAGIAVTKAGVPGKSIDAAARKVIEDAGYGGVFRPRLRPQPGHRDPRVPNANTGRRLCCRWAPWCPPSRASTCPGNLGVRIEDVTVLTADGCIGPSPNPPKS